MSGFLSACDGNERQGPGAPGDREAPGGEGGPNGRMGCCPDGQCARGASGPLRPHAETGPERRVGAVLAELSFRGNDGALPVLSSGKKLDVAPHFSYILKRLYLSLLRVGMFKEATTAPFCKWLQKRGFISRPLDRRSSDRRICSEDPPPPLLCTSPGLKTGRGSLRFRSDGRGPLRSTVNSP